MNIIFLLVSCLLPALGTAGVAQACDEVIPETRYVGNLAHRDFSGQDLRYMQKRKMKVMGQFIRHAYHTHIQTLIIVTGRGLNNPKGEKGVLHNICWQKIKDCHRKYVKRAHPMNKGGRSQGEPQEKT